MRAWTAARRGRSPRLGYLLALVALCLQLAAPAWLAPPASSAAQDEFAEFLRLHALCLSGDPARKPPEAPAQDRSDHTGHHVGACCVLHGNASAFPVPPSTIRPVAFRFSEVSSRLTRPPKFAARPAAIPRARAPPGEA